MKPIKPYLTVDPLDLTIESGRNVNLTCESDSAGNMSYILVKDNVNVASQFRNSFVLRNVSATESGNYSCSAIRKGVSSEESNSHILTIVGEQSMFFLVLFIVYIPCLQIVLVFNPFVKYISKIYILMH